MEYKNTPCNKLATSDGCHRFWLKRIAHPNWANIKMCILATLLLLASWGSRAQTTYTWTGSTSAAWATSTNWSPNGNPGAVAGDAVIIPTTTNAPTLSVAPANALASITFTTTTTKTLTITGVTLDVTGAVTLNSVAGTATACAIAGIGTLNCGSIVIGSTVTPATSTVVSTLTSTVASINVSGNITLNSYFTSGTIRNHPAFTHTSGTINLSGQITTVNANAANTATYTLGASSPVLNLSFAGNPFNPSITGTSTFTLTGAGATVNYNGTSVQTVGAYTYNNLSIVNTSATVALGGAITTNGTLTIDPSATLNTSASNFGITFNGDFVNNGTFTANASPITIGGALTQSIAGVTTTGLVSMTKTSLIATFQGNVNGGGLTINGSGGTLNLGTGLTHTFTGDWTRTLGTLQGGTSTLRIGGNVSGTGGTFTANTGTIEWNATGSQTIAGLTYNNITFSGSGTKTINAANIIANGTFTIANGVTFDGSTRAVTLNGDFVETGTFSNAGAGVFIGGAATQIIDGFTTTGTVTMNKTGGTATFQGNVNGAGLTISGTSPGTLSLGTSLTHTFTFDVTLTAGTTGILDGGSSTLNANSSTATAWNGTGSKFTPATSTVVFGGVAQTIAATTTFNNLQFSGSGTKTLGVATTTVNGTVTVNGVTLALVTRTLVAKGDVTNNGSITSTSGTLNMNGSAAQTILGSGTWTAATSGYLSNLTIDNSSGGVDLQMPLGIQNGLNLSNGVLSATGLGALTLGTGTAVTLTTTRANGSISLTPTFNLTNVTYNVTYNAATSGITTGIELPASGTNTITANNSHAAGVLLGANTTAASLTVNASMLFNFNDKILTLTSAAPVSNLGTVNISATNSTLAFTGTNAQLIAIGTYTSSIVANLVSNNTLTTLTTPGLRLPTNINIGSLTVNAGAVLNLAAVTINVSGNITNNGTIVATSGTMVLNGSSQQIISGSGTYATGVNPINNSGAFPNITINNSSGVDLQMPLIIQNGLNLTNGVLSASGLGALTLGTGTVATLTMTRTNGSLSLTPAFNLTSVTFNAVYGNASAVPQITTGNEIPSSFNALTLNNPTNGVALGKSITLNAASEAVTFTNGILTLGNFNLTISSTAALALGAGSTTSFIAADATAGNTGQLIRATSGAVSYTFPVGDITGFAEYSRVVLAFSVNGTPRNIGVQVVDDNHPSNDPAASDYISRYWKITDSQFGNGTYTYQPTFVFVAADQVGNFSAMSTNRWNGIGWNAFVNGGASPSLNAVGSVTEANFALGASAGGSSDFTGRVNSTTYTWTGGAGDGLWGSANNWSPSRSSTSVNDIMQFNSGGTITVTGVPAQTIRQLLISGNTNVTLQAGSAVSLSVSGAPSVNNLDVASGSTLQIGGGAGTLTLTYLAGGVTGQIANIAGALTLNTSGAFSSGIATTTVNVGGTLTVSGGTYTAANTATTINGSMTYNSGTITSTTGNLTFGEGSNYYHAVASGSIPAATWTNTGSGSTCNVNADASATFSAATYSNINVLVTGILTNSGLAVTVAGSTNISGTLNITSATGAKIFTGLVTINSGGAWNNNTANSTATFQGGITNNGTFNAGSGLQTFSTNGQALTGTFSIPSVTVTGIMLTNNNSLTAATALTGTGGLTQADNAVLNIGGTSAITTLTASTSGNTVNYNGATQTVKATAYHHLTLSGSGAKTMTSVSTINGDFIMTASAAATAAAALTIGGSVTLGGGSFISGSFTHNVAGDLYHNTGTFTTTGSTYNFNGTTPRTIGGALAPSFVNLTINKTSGAGISLSNSATVSGTLNLTSGNLTLGAYNLTLSGSLSGGSSASYIVSEGTGTLIQNVSTTSKTFPVGTATDYMPVSFSSGTAVNFNVRTKTPSGTPPNSVTLSSVWEITAASGTPTITPVFTWTVGVNNSLGTPNTLYKYNGSWTDASLPPASTGTYTATYTGASCCGEFSPGIINCTQPTTQASVFGSNNIVDISANISFTRGDGDGGVIVVAKAGGYPASNPVSGTTYTANSAYGTPSAALGEGFVVYNGTAGGINTATGNLTVSGLSAATTYYFNIYEYNATGPCYMALNKLQGSFTTLCVPVNVSAHSVVGCNGNAAVTWTNSSCYDEVVIVAKAGSSVTGTPSGDGTSYTGNLAFGSGTAFGGGFVVYKGSTSLQVISSLTNGTTYFVKAFTRKGTLWSSGMETTVTPDVLCSAGGTTLNSFALYNPFFNTSQTTAGAAEDYRIALAYTQADFGSPGTTSISKIAWYLRSSTGSGSTGTYQNFTIKLKSVPTFPGSGFLTGTTDYAQGTITINPTTYSNGSWVEFNISPAFTWNGSDKLYIETCYDNPNGSPVGNNTITMGGTIVDNTHQFSRLSQNSSPFLIGISGCTNNSIVGGTAGTPLPAVRINVSASPALPIELVSFSAECQADQSRLFEWQTASEHNNDFFTIEESVDGTTWNILATIEGAGNSVQLIDYNYSYRMETLETGEIHYYRLKQTDFDGAFDYSGTISLSCDADWMSYFTNPMHGNTIEGVLISPVESSAQVQLYTPTGQLIGEQVLSIKKGANLIEFTNQQLNPGIYLVRIHVENEVYMHKIMVSN